MVNIPRTDIDVHPLNLGGNVFGWTADEGTSFAILDAYAAGGGNFIDTADVYSAWKPGNHGGESETIVGRWLARRGNRDEVVIATKVGKHPAFSGLAEPNVRAACEASLRRLGTDRIDLYYAHADDDTQGVEDLAETFDALVRDGLVRAVALSNFSVPRASAWIQHARANGLSAPVALQPAYNLVHRSEYERTIVPFVTEYDLAVFPYYGLASGFLTGKYRVDADLAGRPRAGSAERYLNADGLRVVDALVDVACAHGVEPASVALSWLLAKGVTAPIASASRPEQVPSLLAAATLELTAAEVRLLDAASAPFAA